MENETDRTNSGKKSRATFGRTVLFLSRICCVQMFARFAIFSIYFSNEYSWNCRSIRNGTSDKDELQQKKTLLLMTFQPAFPFCRIYTYLPYTFSLNTFLNAFISNIKFICVWLWVCVCIIFFYVLQLFRTIYLYLIFLVCFNTYFCPPDPIWLWECLHLSDSNKPTHTKIHETYVYLCTFWQDMRIRYTSDQFQNTRFQWLIAMKGLQLICPIRKNCDELELATIARIVWNVPQWK